MKNTKYYNIRTVQNSKRKIVESNQIDTPQMHIHDRSPSYKIIVNIGIVTN